MWNVYKNGKLLRTALTKRAAGIAAKRLGGVVYKAEDVAMPIRATQGIDEAVVQAMQRVLDAHDETFKRLKDVDAD